MTQTEKVKVRERGYKYQLLEPYTIAVDIFDHDIETQYFSITPNGLLEINPLYAWDGASGPTIDNDNTIIPSLVHDTLYQAIRLEMLSKEYKDYADELLREMLIERGMNRIRANVWYEGVHLFGGGSCKEGTDNENIKEVW